MESTVTLSTSLPALPDFIHTRPRRTDADQDIIDSIIDQADPLLWLESGSHGSRQIMAGCRWKITGRSDSWILERPGQAPLHMPRSSWPLTELLNQLEKNWLGRQHAECRIGIILPYETGWDWEKRRRAPACTPLEDIVIFCPEVVVRQALQGEAILSCDATCPDLSISPAQPRKPMEQYAAGVVIRPQTSKPDYLANVLSIKDEIRQGNSFQVNYSQEFIAEGSIDALAWARHLFAAEPAPFMAYFRNAGHEIVSLSPERLVKKTAGGEVITRPIAGTLPKRGQANPAHASQRFKDNAKELAEHNMLIDLERNDLGKICAVGSVHIPEYLTVEELPHLYHLVSEVRGQLQAGTGCGDIVKALFPGGTITGCPKLETMHILDRIENGVRGPYTGSLGYLSANGEMDLNILIRTATLLHNKCHMRFGGGIVWDSDPGTEYLETLAKARGLLGSLIKGGAEIDLGHRSLRQFFA